MTTSWAAADGDVDVAVIGGDGVVCSGDSSLLDSWRWCKERCRARDRADDVNPPPLLVASGSATITIAGSRSPLLDDSSPGLATLLLLSALRGVVCPADTDSGGVLIL